MLALLVTACGAQPNGPQAPEIIYGQTVCTECGMIISDAQFAAATLVENGDSHTFESIADMVAYHMERPNEKVQAWFVHDYNSATWIRAETAFYVVSDQLRSPMPPGVAAFENQESARELAASLGVNVLAFDDMRLAVHLIVHG
jgi:copper chaperone NosL